MNKIAISLTVDQAIALLDLIQVAIEDEIDFPPEIHEIKDMINDKMVCQDKE